ncbi:hypothetical protein [Dongia sp.]|uniref:hypothetical protein n=1 Tax=Dongia sp. TaxID=1977262 RepID=UPI003750FAB5
MMANLASAEEVGTANQMAGENGQANVSSSDENAMPTDASSDVEYRRKERSGDSGRTGRSDRSSEGSGGQSDSSGGGESGDGGDGD